MILSRKNELEKNLIKQYFAFIEHAELAYKIEISQQSSI